VDEDLALLGLVFRVGEGLTGAMANHTTLQILWLASSGAAFAASPAAVATLGACSFSAPEGGTHAIFFAMGSTLFSCLLLRGRTVPVALAWFGVAASILIAVALPLEYAGFISGGRVTWLSIAMALNEVPLGLWLIIRGARSSTLERTPTVA